MSRVKTWWASCVCLGVAFVAAAVLAVVILAPASARPQEASKYGGTLVVGQAAEPNSLDPTVGSTASRIPINTMCLKLYGYAKNHGRLELAPVLAAAPAALSADKR